MSIYANEQGRMSRFLHLEVSGLEMHSAKHSITSFDITHILGVSRLKKKRKTQIFANVLLHIQYKRRYKKVSNK